MNKHLPLIPKQRKELESDWTREYFLNKYEKNPSFKACFEFKTKMFASMKSQRMSLVPLFRQLDKVAQVKQCVDETLDISGTAVVPEGNPEAGYTGWEEENVPAIVKPLLTLPQVPLRQEEDELNHTYIEGLDPQIVEWIQEKARAKAVLNRKHARALFTYECHFRQMYAALASLANVTSNSVCVYLRLFEISDFNQRRLVRSKMSTIFKPNFRLALNTNTSDSSQGIFGGVSNVIKNLKEAKETNTLVKSSLFQTKKLGKADTKSGKNKGKKPVAGGFKAKGKKGSKKNAGSKNTKAKGGSGNNKEKEDSSKERKKDELCKLVTNESFTSCHPSNPGL